MMSFLTASMNISSSGGALVDLWYVDASPFLPILYAVNFISQATRQIWGGGLNICTIFDMVCHSLSFLIPKIHSNPLLVSYLFLQTIWRWWKQHPMWYSETHIVNSEKMWAFHPFANTALTLLCSILSSSDLSTHSQRTTLTASNLSIVHLTRTLWMQFDRPQTEQLWWRSRALDRTL